MSFFVSNGRECAVEESATTSRATKSVIVFAKVALVAAIFFFLFTFYKGMIHVADSTQVFISVAILSIGLLSNYFLEKICKGEI